MQDVPLAEKERDEAEALTAPSARVVHAAVSTQAEDELGRPLASLFWSGVAAGIAMMASVSASGALHHQLPEAPWRDAVVALGYPIGFVIVILGRLELFTEHTMVAVLPLARRPSRRNAARVARLWSAVFAGNILGAAAVAALVVFARVQSAELYAGMVEVAARLREKDAVAMLLEGIPAGFLIAALAWIRSAAEDAGFWVVVAVTLVIGLCGFTHVVAGACDAFILLWRGDVGAGWLVTGFLLPALAGNIIGGTGLFAVLAHAQVSREL